MADRVDHFKKDDILLSAKRTRGMVTINSTSGTLDDFWKNLGRPEEVTFTAFRRVLFDHCLVPGGFFARKARPGDARRDRTVEERSAGVIGVCLAVLDRTHELDRAQQGAIGAELGKAAPHWLDRQLGRIELAAPEIGDLQLAAFGRFVAIERS